MVLLCFGSYFAGIRRNQAKSDKWQSSGNQHASRIASYAGHIRAQHDFRRDSHSSPENYMTRVASTPCGSRRMLPPDPNRARLKPSLKPVAYIKRSPATETGVLFPPSDSNHFWSREEGARLGEAWRRRLRSEINRKNLISTSLFKADHDLFYLFLFYSLFYHG